MIFFVAIALGQTVVNAYGPSYFLAMGGVGLILSFIFAHDPSPAVKITYGKILDQHFLVLSRSNLNCPPLINTAPCNNLSGIS
jgi:hypothetical protein